MIPIMLRLSSVLFWAVLSSVCDLERGPGISSSPDCPVIKVKDQYYSGSFQVIIPYSADDYPDYEQEEYEPDYLK